MRKQYMIVLAGLLGLGLLGLVAVIGFRAPAAEVTVLLNDYSITTSHLAVPKGALVRLTVMNLGSQVHELEVMGYDKELEDIAPGQTRTLTFRATRAGAVELACHVEGHYEKGMQTVLQVVD